MTNSSCGGRNKESLKRELRKLVDLVVDEDDYSIEILDEIARSATAIKELTSNHNITQKNCHSITQKNCHNITQKNCASEKKDVVAVPEYFCCPISSELMADPVLLVTGQTYDRAYIQEWLDADNKTCPATQQVLSHTDLTPNDLVRTMIEKWCLSQSLQPPANSVAEGDNEITTQQAKYLRILVHKLSGNCKTQQRDASRELRVLSRKKPSHRIFLGNPKTLAALIFLLGSPDQETQEHAVTILLNLSIHEQNKVFLAECGGIQPIVDVLQNGMSMASKENAAAALFSLSSVYENKVKIGLQPNAIPSLVMLLREGNPRGLKDGASAIFSLCIHEENKSKCVEAGLVPLLLNFMKKEGEEMMRDEWLALLAIVSSDEGAAEAIADGGGLSVLMDVITGENESPRNKENAIGILVGLCARDSANLKEVKRGGYMELVDVSLNGTSRARRKAKTLLDRMNRQQRTF